MLVLLWHNLLFFLEQVVTCPTRKSNILDIIFSSGDVISDIETRNTCISDHNIQDVATNFSCGFGVPTPVFNPPDNPFDLFDLQKCDWEVLGANLQSIDWGLALNSSSVASCLVVVFYPFSHDL